MAKQKEMVVSTFPYLRLRSRAYEAAFDRVVIPALEAYQPELIIVPSGLMEERNHWQTDDDK